MQIDIDFAQRTLKYVAALLTTALGIAAVFGRLRDETTKRVTKSGRWLFATILISGLLLVALQITDDISAKRARAEQLIRDAANAELQRQVARSNYQIRDVQLYYELTFRGEHADLASFAQRLSLPMPNGLLAPFYGIPICRGSKRFPSERTEPILRKALDLVMFELSIHRHPVLPAQMTTAFISSEVLPSTVRRPDLLLVLVGQESECVKPEFNEKTNEWELHINGTAASLGAAGTGQVSSLVDLAGAQMVLGGDTVDTPFVEAKQIQLYLGTVGHLRIASQQFRSHLGVSHRYWEYRFPARFEQIQQQMQRN